MFSVGSKGGIKGLCYLKWLNRKSNGGNKFHSLVLLLKTLPCKVEIRFFTFRDTLTRILIKEKINILNLHLLLLFFFLRSFMFSIINNKHSIQRSTILDLGFDMSTFISTMNAKLLEFS